MDILVRVGAAAGADGLIDVTRAHLVGAYDIGPANRALLVARSDPADLLDALGAHEPTREPKWIGDDRI
jgi:hypothetical protein